MEAVRGWVWIFSGIAHYNNIIVYCVVCPVQLFLKYIQLNPSTTATLGTEGGH